MLSVNQALAQIQKWATPLAPRPLELNQSLGRILAADILADVDSPPHDKSIVDGYALRSSDAAPGGELQVLETVLAGQTPTREMTPGTATQIMTGAPIPTGADAVVMVEQTERIGENRVRLHVSAKAGQNIVRQGAAFRRGQRLLTAGTRVRPIEVGLLAEVGCAQPLCIPAPTVAVLPTGNELVAPHEVPGPGQIRNSNGCMLESMVHGLSLECDLIPAARDEPADLRQKIERGLQADVLVISGGVSAGLADLVPTALQQLGVQEVFHKVAVKPGKPLWFGVRSVSGKTTLVFGLPGNPVSSLVCFHLFVRPALLALAGDVFSEPRHVLANLQTEFHQRGDRESYLPAVLNCDGNSATVELVRWQGSGDLAGLAAANALAVIPAAERLYARGESISCLWL